MVYIRKYAGPLQKGKRSAYVPSSRKNKRSYRSKPPRLASGYTSYKSSYKSSKKLKNFGEVKLQSIKGISNEAPVRMNPVTAPVPVYGLRYVIGAALTQYPTYAALQGMTWPKGTDFDERIGKYMYFKKVSLTMEINMNQVGDTNSGPRRFRLIIFKARRYASPTGTSPNPDGNLMLTANGNPFGVSSNLAEMMDFTHQITNKRQYQIIKDTSFILQNPVGNPSASVDPFIGTSGQYKSTKTIRCSLPLWKKTHFNDTTNLPDNLNYNYGIYLQALNVGSNTAIPDDFNLSMRGTVSANDV